MATSNPLDSLAAGDKASSAVAASISKKETETHKKRGREKCGSTLVSEGVASDHYKPITAYEGIHRYDPDFEWGPTEEKRIIDMRICSWVCLMFFALQLDRGNISQALSDNMLGGLGLNTND
ncbi:hypothetical protein BM1_02920 [Bipolaris maydis]|nr:hypothetical protein BM1_02920 [Bipolaris maydis]